MAHDFGEIRAILQQVPDEKLWAELCWKIEQWDLEVFQSQLYPYIESHLSRWQSPDIAYLPGIWRKRLLAGKSEPRVRLCRTIRSNASLTLQQAKYLAQSEDLCNIQATRWSQNHYGEDVMDVLGRADWQRHVSELLLRHNEHAANLFVMPWPNLESLSIGSYSSVQLPEVSWWDAVWDNVRRHIVEERLRVLKLGVLSPDDFDWMVRASALIFPNLKHLSLQISSGFSVVELERLIEAMPSLQRVEIHVVLQQEGRLQKAMREMEKRCKARGLITYFYAGQWW